MRSKGTPTSKLRSRFDERQKDAITKVNARKHVGVTDPVLIIGELRATAAIQDHYEDF